MKYNDYPIEECAKGAQERIDAGFKIYQKFSCAYCGARQTIDEPNKFFTSGSCEKCKRITRIDKCNYVAIWNG